MCRCEGDLKGMIKRYGSAELLAEHFGEKIRAATHEFVPVKPAKKQFMYWGGAPDSAAVMLVDRFAKYLTRLIPSHYQLT